VECRCSFVEERPLQEKTPRGLSLRRALFAGRALEKAPRKALFAGRAPEYRVFFLQKDST